MNSTITIDQLSKAGLNTDNVKELFEKIQSPLKNSPSPAEAWRAVSQILAEASYPFGVHLLLYSALFPKWREHPESAPAWLPTSEIRQSANITALMGAVKIKDIKAFHQWTVNHYEDFWQRVITQLNIVFKKKPDRICHLERGVESPQWLSGAKLNIADSCFGAPSEATALIYEDQKKNKCHLTYGELNGLSNRIANSLIKHGFVAGDAIGIAMPMNIYAIAIYLGIIKMGGIVVSIADSFSSHEMAIRLNIAKTKAVFTQDQILWDGKTLPLYEKVCKANAAKILVLPHADKISLQLRPGDIAWNDFLTEDTRFSSFSCEPMSACNILFSSGTTGEPKAIPWNHTTAIKAASDAYFHQNIQPGDVLCWPTNLGWMMGPWLIFAALMNHAAIALYQGAPKNRDFGLFVERARVTMLGVVPTLVAAWRQSGCMEKLDWRAIKVFSSTGECSNPEDMLYLMSLAGYKPVIEYCGGTEIGGAYITSTVIENNCPSLFSTPAMGLDFVLIDEEGHFANTGEVAIIPPSLGLSTCLLNADHHQVYYADMPLWQGKILRRHGDQLRRYPNGYYSILGRVDDTMNLGGIKISAAEIERTITGIEQITEVAAIAVSPPDNGPSQLIIYAVTPAKLDKDIIKMEMQKRINAYLNPLFKIHDVLFINELPRTASNKTMRRVLRKNYLAK